MIKRKLLALGLAVVMTLSSSVVAFADYANNLSADATDYGKGVTVTSSTETPTISVQVPTTTAFILNPYKLSAATATAASNGSSDAVADTVKSQIIAPTYNILSASNVALQLSIKISNVKVNDDSSFVLSSAALTGKETTKTAFIWIDFKNDGGKYGRTSLLTATEATYGTDCSETDSKYVGAKTQAVLHTTAVTAKNGTVTDTPYGLDKFITVPAKTDSGNGKVSYSFFGSVNSAASEKWTATDGVSFDIRFTFTPVANTVTD
jgi:hypothetical protein